MLKFYLATIVVWMIIIFCTVAIFRETLKRRLGFVGSRKTNLFGVMKILFIYAAVPIVRLFFVATIIFVATCNQEDLNKFIENYKKNKD